MSAAPIGSFSTHVTYDLPPTVKSLQSSWLATLQCSATISALFSVMEVHLLGYMNNALQTRVGENSAMGQALLAFTYLSLFLSISATMSSLVLTDELGEVPLRASRSKDSLRYSTYDEPSDKLLTRFNGGRRSWRWVMWHWLFTLVTGYICIIVQLVLYVWSSEQSVGIKGAVIFIAVFSSLPIFDLFLPSFINRTISAASPGSMAA